MHLSRELSPAPDSQWHRLLSVLSLLASQTEVYATKISSMGVPAASKRVGKGFAAKDNVGFRHAGRISVLSPPASSEADLGLAELAQAGTEFKIQEEPKR